MGQSKQQVIVEAMLKGETFPSQEDCSISHLRQVLESMVTNDTRARSEPRPSPTSRLQKMLKMSPTLLMIVSDEFLGGVEHVGRFLVVVEWFQ